MSNMLSLNLRSMPFIMDVSMSVPADVQSGCAEMRARFAEMKSALMSAAEMWSCLWAVMAAFRMHWIVRTAGPQALSRMRRGSVGAGRCGFMRAIRWSAKMMLQPPVRSL